ncbi:hypothetical protein NBRC116592_32470 [Colwellia sp. KU-HH00111]|uniref:hypothetical protein n=1 Tax=Colwellia sp. KU-HH00111 TaxID=3127652 RepID=UPI00310811AC
MKLVLNLFNNPHKCVPSFKFTQRLPLKKVILILGGIVCLSACQLTEPYSNANSLVSNTINYSQYYLALKNLSKPELQREIQLQQLKESQGSIAAEINLMLLHSLPNSPSHNVYSAKSKLNEQLKRHDSYQLNSDDQAFFSLLKDQLNQQLFLFQKLINQELAHDKQAEKYSINDKKQKNKIAALELTVAQLSKQITQLKKIEQTISGHGH